MNGTVWAARDDAALVGSLAPEERRRITIRLGAGLVGLGLLGLGTLLIRLAPDQRQIGELCRALAAAVVAVPTLVSGLRGVVTGEVLVIRTDPETPLSQEDYPLGKLIALSDPSRCTAAS